MQGSSSSLVEIHVVGLRTDGKSKLDGMQRSQSMRGTENIEEILEDLGKERPRAEKGIRWAQFEEGRCR